MQTKNLAAVFTGFSKLGRDERLKALLDMGALDADDIAYLHNGGLKDISFADNFIENAIGYLEIPLGIATNFRIDGRDYAIPMEDLMLAGASACKPTGAGVGGFVLSLWSSPPPALLHDRLIPCFAPAG